MINLILCLEACTISGALAGLLILLLKKLLGDRLSPQWHCYVWIVMMVLLLVPIAVKFPELPLTVPELVEVQRTPEPKPLQEVELIVEPSPRYESSELVEIPQYPQPVVENVTPTPERSFSLLDYWWELLTLIWLGGVLLFFGKQLVGYRAFRKQLLDHSHGADEESLRLLRQCEEQLQILHPVELAITDLSITPMIVGWKKPTLFIPKGLEPQKLSLIFVHELTHYRYGDLFYKLMALILQGIHWFNPLCKVMVEDIDFSCELCCDRRVTRQIGGERSREYGTLLLELLSRSGAHNNPSATFSMDKRALKRRLSLIMKPKQTSKVLAILICVALVLGGSACNAAIAPELEVDTDAIKDTLESLGSQGDRVQYVFYERHLLESYVNKRAEVKIAEWLQDCRLDSNATVHTLKYVEKKGSTDTYYLIYDPALGLASDLEVEISDSHNDIKVSASSDTAEAEEVLILVGYSDSQAILGNVPKLLYELDGVEQSCSVREVDFDFLFPTDSQVVNLSEADIQLLCPLGSAADQEPVKAYSNEHTAVDWYAPAGTAIFAAHEGIVTKADFDQANGNYLWIEREDGLETAYHHCEELLVKAGERVEAGQVIATVGSTGQSTGPHLHFQLLYQDIALDPMEWLSEEPVEENFPPLLYPLPKEADSEISALFGAYENHQGVDFSANKGTEILAAEDGVVLASEWADASGFTIRLDHGDGLQTVYAHCDRLLVELGEQVKQGQAIATVGSSGNATGNHLHFEVLLQGVPMDPAYFIADIPQGNSENVDTIYVRSKTIPEEILDTIYTAPVGTAGSSLQQLSAALRMLQLSQMEESDRADSLEWYLAQLDDAGKEHFFEQWQRISTTAYDLLTEEHAADRLADIGMEETDLGRYTQQALEAMDVQLRMLLEEQTLSHAEVDDALIQDILINFGAKQNEQGFLQPHKGASLFYSQGFDEKSLTPENLYSWYLGYMWREDLTLEERQEKYKNPIGENMGWFFPEEIYEPVVQSYFNVSTDFLRSATFYHPDYQGYNISDGGGIGETPLIYTTDWTQEGELLTIDLLLDHPFSDDYEMELTVQLTEDGYYYLSYLPQN